MTKKELEDFCVENAGKIASGRSRGTARTVKGRIIAFTVDQFNQALILLEDEKGPDNKNVPNPLPSIPYSIKGWSRVVSPSKIGFPVFADTVVVVSEVSDQIPATAPKAVKQVDDTYIPDTVAKICIHNECDPTWCHRKYAGII